MTGNLVEMEREVWRDRTRFCRLCAKNVYNLSKMSAEAAAELIRQNEGQLCARIYQRRDGTVLTADCPVGLKRPILWFKEVFSAAATTVAACFCLAFPAFGDDARKVKDSSNGQGATTPRMLMGAICVAPPKTNSVSQVTNTPPLLGKI